MGSLDLGFKRFKTFPRKAFAVMGINMATAPCDKSRGQISTAHSTLFALYEEHPTVNMDTLNMNKYAKHPGPDIDKIAIQMHSNW